MPISKMFFIFKYQPLKVGGAGLCPIKKYSKPASVLLDEGRIMP